MNAYFFKMSKEEKDNILDQHKHLYDGYVTNYEQKSTQPLYVQDYANDKGGITVNNKGNVTEYKNVNINEMRFDGKSTGLFDEDAQSGSGVLPTQNIGEDDYSEVEEQLDMIGDNEDDLEHGTFDELDEEEFDYIKESINKTLDMFKRFKKY